jgi:hypothetical protein
LRMAFVRGVAQECVFTSIRPAARTLDPDSVPAISHSGAADDRAATGAGSILRRRKEDRMMEKTKTTYYCKCRGSDEESEQIESMTAADAAAEHARYCTEVDRDEDTTWWLHVTVVHGDEKTAEDIMVEIHPPEPACEATCGHEWIAPYELVGGLRENPGCWSHGGGLISDEICRHCGCKRITDTWAQDPETGAQGLTSIRYIEHDD